MINPRDLKESRTSVVVAAGLQEQAAFKVDGPKLFQTIADILKGEVFDGGSGSGGGCSCRGATIFGDPQRTHHARERTMEVPVT